MKKSLTWLLVLTMLLALLPVSAFAADADPASGWGAYDELIASVRTERDPAKRAELMHQAEDLLMSTSSVVPLYYYTHSWLQKPYVENAVTDASGWYQLAYASMTNGSTSLRAGLGPSYETLDPAMLYDTGTMSASMLAFRGLFGYQPDGSIGPACAESCEVSDDGLTYTVKLRDGLKWSDGSALTAADFEYAWKRAASDDTGASYGYLFENFAGYPEIDVTASDDVTLRFALASPCAYMESLLTHPIFFPLKRSAVEASPEDWASGAGFVCNGPFTVTAFEADSGATFSRNPAYYDAVHVALDKIELVFDAGDGLLDPYQNGALDLLTYFDVSDPSYDRSEYHACSDSGLYYCMFNVQSPIFADKTPAQANAMREAMSMVIDRQAICTASASGVVSADTFIPYEMLDSTGGVYRAAGDAGYYDASAISSDREATLDAARQLMQSAGFSFDGDGKLSDSTPLTIRYLYSSNTIHKTVGELIRSALGAIGITVELQEDDWSAFSNPDRTDYDLIRGGYISDANDPEELLRLMTTTGANRCHFGDDPSATPTPTDPVEEHTHQIELKNAKDATCTDAGYTGDKVCSICGETVEQGKIIPAKGHGWSEWTVTKEPTETAEGEESRMCAACLKVETRSIPKLNPTPASPDPTTKPDDPKPVDPSPKPDDAKPVDPAPKPADPIPPVEFKDVEDNAYYAQPVAWAVDKQITDGTSDTTFSPDDTCTRGQIVTFLWRAAEKPEPKSSTNPFTDVQESDYFYKAVLWAVEQGITDGTSETTFSPNDGCTRGQVVTFMHRANALPEVKNASNPFADVTHSEYYYAAVLWAVQQGITDGTSDTTFSPDATCTRGQIVTFLYRDMA